MPSGPLELAFTGIFTNMHLSAALHLKDVCDHVVHFHLEAPGEQDRVRLFITVSWVLGPGPGAQAGLEKSLRQDRMSLWERETDRDTRRDRELPERWDARVWRPGPRPATGHLAPRPGLGPRCLPPGGGGRL